VSTKPTSSDSHLARRLGLFDATMIVMGGIIGAGIFTNPYVVAQQVHTPLLILGAWAVGGLIALAGAFIYAELSSQVSASGGQYVYLRDAMHPLVGFVYGWSLLFVIQTGGMAAVALIFANHLFELMGIPTNDFRAALLGSGALALLTVVNCVGVRAGTATQNILMVLKLIAECRTRHCITGKHLAITDRIWRSLDSGAVCVRRLADRVFRCRRGARATQESATRLVVRGVGSDCRLPIG
jgi:amino acid transporter